METRPDFRKSVAVVIGINAYDHGVPPLGTAAHDAHRLGQLLADSHGYDVRLLLDEQATLHNVRDLLEVTLPAEVGPDDRVLFYFAGHGVALDGEDGPTGYLLAQDARRGEPESYWHMPVLYDALCALACRHMLVILDSCFSGAFRWSTTRDMVGLPDVIHQERYDRFILDPAWQALASASFDQTALDQLPAYGSFGIRGDEGAHSPFALALFEALEGAGDVVPADVGDGVITATELYLYLEERLQPAAIEAGHRQTPRLWPLPKHDKGEYIFLSPGHTLNLPPAPPLTYENNPWRGLESYDEEHADLFFGREDVIEALHSQMEEHALTVVLGASGTGKSSVVKAGLLPKLKRDVAQAWLVLPVVRPGAAPVEALHRALSELGTEATVTEPTVDERVAAWCAAHPDTRLLLVIDQLEELVTMTRSAEEREATLGLLARLVEAHPDRLRVILTLRSDFEPQFDRSALQAHWKQARYVVPPLTQADLREVIEQPASQRVMYFKPHGLVDTLINEVIQTPGGLPLLSFALSEMYVHYVDRRSDDRSIEDVDYQAVGGVVGALRTRANAEFDALDAAHRETMRRLMLRMVAAEGGNVARRRVPRSELDYPDPAETERADDVVRRLTAARLVVEGRGEDGEGYVEPAHDALVRAWDRLLGWIHAEQDRAANLRFQQSLARTARDWTQTSDKKAKAGLLWRDAARGGVLSQLVAREEEALGAGALTTGQRLRRSAGALQRRLLPGRRSDESGVWMNRRELDFARRSIRRRRNIRFGLTALVLLIALGAVAATVFGIEAQRQQRQAERERDNALSGALAARSTSAMQSGDRALATLLAVQGNRIVETSQTRQALLQSLQARSDYYVYPHPQKEPDYEALADALLPASTVDADSYYDGSASVVDSPDGALRAVGGNFLLELRDVATDSVLWQTQEHSGFVTRLAFSPDGALLASGDENGGIRLWNIVKGGAAAGYTEVRTPSEDPTQEGTGVLTFNPQGTLVALLNEGVVRVWDGHSRALLGEAAVPLDEISAMRFSRDGTRLVFVENTAPVYSDEVKEDTMRLHVWDAERRAFLYRDPVEHLGTGTLSPDGAWLALARGDAVRVWDVAGRAFRGDPIPLSYPVTEVRFSPDAERLAITTGDADGYKASVTVWDLTTRRAVGAPFGVPPYDLSPAYFDGQSLRGLAFPTVRMWEWTGMAFGEDSIALADVLPDFADGFDGPEPVLSPSGDLMAFGDCYTDCIHINIGLLDLERRDAFWGSFDFGGGMMRSLSLSPDSRLLVIEYQGGGVQLWDIAGREELGAPFPHPGDVDLLAFSPDGTYLATAGYDFGTQALFMRRWDLRTSSWTEQACRLVNRNLSTQEWSALLGDRPYACTCPNLPPHPSTGLPACP